MSTLQNQSGIQLARATVRQDKGVLQQAQGAFDWTPQLGTAAGSSRELGIGSAGPAFDKTRAVETSIGATKQFRSGIAVSPEISLTRTDQNESYDPLTQSEISISMTVPLLKGGGRVSAQAGERAALENLRATGERQVHQVNQLLFGTVSAYWRVCGAWQSLQVTESSLERAKKAAALVGSLVQGGQLTPNDRQRALAEIHLRGIAVNKQHESLHSAGQALIDAMGVMAEDDDFRMATPLPNPMAPRFETAPSARDLVTLALARRRDLAAARRRTEANEILEARFRHDLKPQLDLSLGLSYRGAETNTHAPLGSVRTLQRDLSGPDYQVGLSLEIPLGNNVAKGRLREQSAKVWGARAETRALESAIRAEVREVAGRLLSSRRRYRMAEETTALYEAVYQDTRDQVIRGEEGVNQLIEIDDKLAETFLRRTEAATDFAIALAELRFATGTVTIRARDADPYSNVEFTPNNFMNLPGPLDEPTERP